MVQINLPAVLAALMATETLMSMAGRNPPDWVRLVAASAAVGTLLLSSRQILIEKDPL